MGFVSNAVGSLLGIPQGNKSPQAVPLQQTVTPEQLAQAQAQQQSAFGMNQNFANAVMGNNGLANQANVFGQQQGLANQFQGIANGTGPNPALAQLNNTTGQNIANQSAMMAGQRGAGANAGMLARQGAMMGGNLQQQAVGQGAALQANQQLAAMNALQNQQNMMGNMANIQVGQQQTAVNNVGSLASQNQGQLLGATGQANQQAIAQQQGINQINAGQQAQQAQATAGLLGGLGAAGMSALTGGAAAATPTMMADGAAPASSTLSMPSNSLLGAKAYASGGTVNSPQSHVSHFFNGLNLQAGGGVPGQATVEGDSLKNDTVPAMLSPQEIVLPRSVTNSKDPGEAAKRFVEAIKTKQAKKSK
jgi:hypothetical protein